MKNFGFILVIFISGNLFSQKAIISTTKTTAFYQWVENPLEIMVENHSCEEIVVAVDKGKLKGSGCKYVYTTDSGYFRNVTVTVGLKQKMEIKKLKDLMFLSNGCQILNPYSVH